MGRPLKSPQALQVGSAMTGSMSFLQSPSRAPGNEVVVLRIRHNKMILQQVVAAGMEEEWHNP